MLAMPKQTCWIYLLSSVFQNLCKEPYFLSALFLSKKNSCFLFTDFSGTKRAARSLSLFAGRYSSSAKILLHGLAVTKLRLKTRMV